MRIAEYVTIFLLLIMPASAGAQAMDNNLSYKNINQHSYFRLNYENDFFSATDRDYTQGIHMELVAPWVKKFPLSKLLVHPGYSYIRYGIGGEHDAYTPNDFAQSTIQYGDHPFTAALFLKTFLIAIDTAHGRRFSTALNTGVIGQAAGGMEMQTFIHRNLHNLMPHGWHNQIHNDAVLNYQVDFEQRLVSVGHFFSMDAAAMGRVGTLSDKASLGITLMGGYFDAPFGSSIAEGKNFRIYAYEHPEADMVGYDATLEGGVFNHTSPYVISPKDLTTFVLQNRFGFVVVYRKLYLEYFQSVIGGEFRHENYHVWGGIQIAFGL